MIPITCLSDWFTPTFDHLVQTMLVHGDAVNTGHWQGVEKDPRTHTVELRDVAIAIGIPSDVATLQSLMEPNLPWAEDHFLERVSGEPLNPGEQYKHWPWYAGGVEEHKETGKFSHTYMERFWPKHAGDGEITVQRIAKQFGRLGVRFAYGDLNDVVDLLVEHPFTRQAYLPVWFPEDTGAVPRERVPCSLGYHFMLRDRALHCLYPMRSVDLLRYLRDDMYMAMRLTQWVVEAARGRAARKTANESSPWFYVRPGELTIHIHSLHVFEGDRPKMLRLREEAIARAA